MKFGTSKQLWEEAPTLKVLLWGQTGAGKTYWAAKAPKPLIIAFEHQALATIINLRSDAFVVMVDNWADFVRVFERVKQSTSTEVEGQPALTVTMGEHDVIYQTLVIDSLTELQRLLLDRIEEPRRVGHPLDPERMPADEGREAFARYGKLLDIGLQVCRDLRSMPCNVICTALSLTKERKDRQGKVISTTIEPDLTGALRGRIGQFFNAVGFAGIASNGSRRCAWEMPGEWTTKRAPGWPKWTPNDVGLGSLLLYSHEGVAVAHEDYDCAELVTRRKANGEEDDV